jgi:hypothetical protein
MDPATDIKQMRDAAMSRVDEQLARTYEQVRSADEQLARVEDQMSRYEPKTTPHSHPERTETRPWLRGIVGLLLAAYILAAALVSQSSYGAVVERWSPQLVSVLSLPKPIVRLAAAESAVQVKPNDATPAAVEAPVEPVKSIETMTRDIADLERKIELLNAMVSDNATAVERIQANQEQAAREIARNAELFKASQEQVAKLVTTTPQPTPRPRTPTPTPPPSGALKPAPTPASSSHASARPQAPTQLRPEQR